MSPTHDFNNIGDVLDFDIVKGTIVSVDDAADTCVVSVAGRNLDALLFYHCEPDSVLRDNGAIEGAAAGFGEDDEVIVLVKKDREVVKVIGHVGGPKPCDVAFALFTIEYFHPQHFDERVKYCVVWDIKKSEAVRWQSGYITTPDAEDYVEWLEGKNVSGFGSARSEIEVVEEQVSKLEKRDQRIYYQWRTVTYALDEYVNKWRPRFMTSGGGLWDGVYLFIDNVPAVDGEWIYAPPTVPTIPQSEVEWTSHDAIAHVVSEIMPQFDIIPPDSAQNHFPERDKDDPPPDPSKTMTQFDDTLALASTPYHYNYQHPSRYLIWTTTTIHDKIYISDPLGIVFEGDKESIAEWWDRETSIWLGRWFNKSDARTDNYRYAHAYANNDYTIATCSIVTVWPLRTITVEPHEPKWGHGSEPTPVASTTRTWDGEPGVIVSAMAHYDKRIGKSIEAPEELEPPFNWKTDTSRNATLEGLIRQAVITAYGDDFTTLEEEGGVFHMPAATINVAIITKENKP